MLGSISTCELFLGEEVDALEAVPGGLHPAGVGFDKARGTGAARVGFYKERSAHGL